MHTYTGKLPDQGWDRNLTEDQVTARLRETAAAVRSLYNKSLPFFTKNHIRDLVRQIDDTNARLKGGESIFNGACKFRLPTLQGDIVEVDVETGSTLNWYPEKPVMYSYSMLQQNTRVKKADRCLQLIVPLQF